VDTTRFDAHCHYLNADYLFSELTEITKRAVLGAFTDRAQGLAPVEVAARPVTKTGTWSELVHFAATVLRVCASSCAGNYGDEQEGYKTSALRPGPLVCAPLMMDILFMFEQGSRTAPPDGLVALLGDDDRAEHARQCREQADALIRQVSDALAESSPSGGAGVEGLRWGALDDLIAEATRIINAALEGDAAGASGGGDSRASSLGIDFTGLDTSPGFRAHLLDLVELSRAHAAQVYPFLAVDPRREGIAEFASRYVTRTGPFYGVKIYPPLGYYPADKRLDPIYELCLARDLPITAHAQPGAFVNPFGTHPRPGHEYANPRGWREVLERPRHGELRLNLAHFGGYEFADAYVQDPACSDDNWTRTIVELMAHPNVFADVAAWEYPEAASVVAALTDRRVSPGLAVPHELIESKLMFGTDFDICMFSPQLDGKVATYFDDFAPLAGGHERFWQANARRFLFGG
jgi:predicted TIM-barrel fold metal-dependent hydrolase